MHRAIATLAFAVIAALLAACGTTGPSYFYVLSSSPAVSTPDALAQEPAIGVGPINIPKYLARPQMVQRSGDHQLELHEQHRWAEPLQDNITRVLAENLARMVPTQQLAVFPWGRSARIDYHVTVEVSQFDADTEGNVTLTALWRVFGRTDEELVRQQLSSFTETAEGTEHAAIAAAHSRALDALSRDIAQVIRQTAARR